MDLFNKESAEIQDDKSVKPLADKMRPDSFDNFYGQKKVIGPGTPLRKAIETDQVNSLIFWGPPGTGKTTLGRLIAKSTKGQFIAFSAVTSGIKDVKAVISKAGDYYKLSGKRTYLFIDEIHRFNKAQQDAFLPYVESGDIILIGATTENPSFEINSALLSRLRVFVLERLTEDDLLEIINHALISKPAGLAEKNISIENDARQF